jgi:hypothetical protein
MKSDLSGDIVLAILLAITVLLNIWVWRFPENYLELMKAGAKRMGPPLGDFYFDLFDTDGYIWLPRIVLGIGLAVLIYVRIVA